MLLTMRKPVPAVATHLAMILLLLPQPLAPAVITVGPECDLRHAIASADLDDAFGNCSQGSGADTIVLTGTVVLATVDHTDPEYGPTGLPQVTSRITIEGNGFVVARNYHSAPDFRIFDIAESGDLTLNDLTVRYGKAKSWGDHGGGILNLGRLALVNSTVGYNYTRGEGGGIFGGSNSTTRIENSTIHHNTAYSFAPRGGGIAVDAQGRLDVVYSSLYENAAIGFLYANAFGGAIATGEGSVTISNTTVNGNSATGGAAFGGGVLGGNLAIINSTISDNTFYSIHGGGGGTGVYGSGRIHNTTFVNNGVWGYYSPSSLIGLRLYNSIFWRGRCGGDVGDGGGNLVSPDTWCLDMPGDLSGLDPVLADNGGPTLTHALLDGSTAINHVINCGLANDQRGAGRIGRCDGGAYEVIGCDILQLENLDISLPAFFPESTCNTAFLGPNLTVMPEGLLWVEAGHQIAIKNGFSVLEDGEAWLNIDPSLLPK